MNSFLTLRIKFTSCLFLLVLSVGCGDTEQKKEYVAKVNDSYLTEEDLTAISGGYGGQKFFKEEIIHNWVNQELLYQKAKEAGILDDENYKRILNRSGKELAAAMMLEKIYSENTPLLKPEEVRDFYEKNGDSFRIHQPAYIIDKAEFTDEDKAVIFRSAAVESEWNKALNFFSSDRTLKKNETNRLIYISDLQPLKVNRILKELNPGEISLIIPGDNKEYIVLKLVEKLEPETIPPFEIIKEEVENRFIALKKSEILKNYLEELYSENDIDVKQ